MTRLAQRPLTKRFHIEVWKDDLGDISIEVVKTTNGQHINLNEPLFLLRARDLLAVPLLLCYRALIKAASYPSPEAKVEHLVSNQNAIEEFERFAKDFPNRMKLPNITRGK